MMSCRTRAPIFGADSITSSRGGQAGDFQVAMGGGFWVAAGALFGHVKTAWRNPTMHIEKTYTPQRAEEILLAVKSFMAHLATKICE